MSSGLFFPSKCMLSIYTVVGCGLWVVGDFSGRTQELSECLERAAAALDFLASASSPVAMSGNTNTVALSIEFGA